MKRIAIVIGAMACACGDDHAAPAPTTAASREPEAVRAPQAPAPSDASPPPPICPADNADCKACVADDFASCTTIGWLMREGRVVTKDLAAAARLFERACNGGDAGGCEAFEMVLRNGEGIPADPDRARAIGARHIALDAAMQAKNLADCEALTPGPDADSCIDAASRIMAGLHTPRDVARALQLYQRACDLGDGRGCTLIAAHSVPKRVEYTKRGCQRGDADACADLVGLYNPPIARSAAKLARESLDKACASSRTKHRQARACQILGEMQWAGIGTKQDREAARAPLTRACRLGNTVACEDLERLAAGEPMKAP